MSKVLNNLLGVLSLPSTRFTSAKQGRHFLQNSSSTGQHCFVYSTSPHPIYGSEQKAKSRDVVGTTRYLFKILPSSQRSPEL